MGVAACQGLDSRFAVVGVLCNLRLNCRAFWDHVWNKAEWWWLHHLLALGGYIPSLSRPMFNKAQSQPHLTRHSECVIHE